MFFTSLLRPRLSRVQEHLRQQHEDNRAQGSAAAAAASAPATAAAAASSTRPASRLRVPEPRHATADFTEADDDDDEDDSNDGIYDQYGDEFAIEDEDGPGHSGPVLPLFSASYLGTSLLLVRAAVLCDPEEDAG